jgi:hypothetical protein
VSNKHGITPGGIEAQEARGQRQFVNSATLPRRCIGCTREQVERMGVVFGADVDALFVNVTLPDGWSKVPTTHSMWSELRDAGGHVRAGIFYKAAFYDRDAHMSLSRYINVTRRYYDKAEGADIGETDAVVINADGAVLFETARVPQNYFKSIDVIEAEAHAWADEHYPDWRDPLAYWE